MKAPGMLARFASTLGRLGRAVRGRIKRLLRPYPFRVNVTAFHPPGCAFEVSTPVEEFRVTGLGGEAEFIQRMLDDVRNGDVFFDIGSCVGLVALHAALRGAQVIAFEPDPSYRARLIRNIDLNGLAAQVRIVDWAVAHEAGTVPLFTDGVDGNSPSLACVGTRGMVSVRTDSLDAALSRGELPFPTVVKLDIEGAEIHAIRGMQQLLAGSHAPRRLFVEFHPEFLRNFGGTVAECAHILDAAGYVQEYSNIRDGQEHRIYAKP